MKKLLLSISATFCLLFFSSCSTSHFYKDDLPQDDAERARRREIIEHELNLIKSGEALIIRLYNGDIYEGTLFTFQDGILSLRLGETFRDFEISDIAGVKRPLSTGRIKMWIGGLIFVTIIFIIYKFSREGN